MPLPTTTPESFQSQNFDYLIIGGGTAGLAIAARLSENPAISVGIIEAGPAEFADPLIDIPGNFGQKVGTKHDWQFKTVPQPGCGGRRLNWPRGKVLGGTSALNFLTWNRGCREDYDAWEKLGNRSWGWDGLLPYFKKSETVHQTDHEHQKRHLSYFDSAYHGTNGPMQIVFSKEYSATHQHWHSSLHKLGVHTNKSPLSGSNVGAWTSLTSVDPLKRARSYAAVTYYKPNASRPNLQLLTRAAVQKIVLEKQGGEWVAKGVDVVCQGQRLTVEAAEVLLSAGSLQSPQLLEVSGIGRRDVLENAGIEVKVENPNVGENLQDHLMTVMVFELDDSIQILDDLKTNPTMAKAASLAYETAQSGPLAMVASSFCYLPLSHDIPSSTLQPLASSASSSPSIYPSHAPILISRFKPGTALGQIEYIFDVGNWSAFYPSQPGKKYGTLLSIYQYPFSRGSVHISSKPSPSSPPTTVDGELVINPKYYEGPHGAADFELFTLAQRFGAKIPRTKPLSSIVKKRVWPPEPANPEEEEFSSYVRDCTVTDYHPVGTCAMGGHEGAKAGVVDDRLRVYGVRGLRVVDASIFPLQIAAHPQATIYAVAEKAADLVLEDWKWDWAGKGKARL